MKLNLLFISLLLLITGSAQPSDLQPPLPQPQVLPTASNLLSTVAAIQHIDLSTVATFIARELEIQKLQIKQLMLNYPISPLQTIHLEVPARYQLPTIYFQAPAMPDALPQAPVAPYVAPAPPNIAAEQAAHTAQKALAAAQKSAAADRLPAPAAIRKRNSSAAPQAQQGKKQCYRGQELTNKGGDVVAIAIRKGRGYSWKCTVNPCKQKKPLDSLQQACDHYDMHCKIKRHPCPFCPDKLTFKARLPRHIKEKHPNEQEGTVDDIQTTTSSSSSSSAAPQAQQRKKRCYHGLELTNEDKKVVATRENTSCSWKCTYDGCEAKLIDSAQQACDHYDTHFGGQRHTCPFCPDKFTFKHELVKHEDRRFICDLCEKKQSLCSTGYNEHMFLTHGIPKPKRRKKTHNGS